MVRKILDDDELKKTLRAFFMEGEISAPLPGRLKMKPLDCYKNSVPKYDFNVKSVEYLEEFIKARIKTEIEHIENPSKIQHEEIIHRKVKRKPKRKTVFLRDFINEIQGTELLYLNIIDAENSRRTN